MASSRRTIFSQLQRLIWERIPARTDGPPSGGFCVPSSGVAGDIVRIFVTQAHSITSITFGGVAATDLQPVGDNEIQCVAGTHIKGLVDVVCTSALGSATLKSAFEYTTGVAPPTLSSANYTQGDTLGGGQPIVLTGTWDVGSAVPQIDGVDLGAGTYTVDSATQITFTLPAHAAGAASVTVRDAGGTSAPLAFTYWAPVNSIDATCTLTIESIAHAYDPVGDSWPAREVVAGNADPALHNITASHHPASGGAPSFDGDAANEGGLKGTASAGRQWQDFLSALRAGTYRDGSVFAVYKSTTTAAVNIAAPFNNAAAVGNLETASGVIGLGAGQYDFGSGAEHAICGHTHDAVVGYKGLAVPAASNVLHAAGLRWDGTSVDLTVDGALTGTQYATSAMTAGLDNVYTPYPFSCGDQYSAAGAANQIFSGVLYGFVILNTKASDTFVTKFYAWARQRFGVA